MGLSRKRWIRIDPLISSFGLSCAQCDQIIPLYLGTRTREVIVLVDHHGNHNALRLENWKVKLIYLGQ